VSPGNVEAVSLAMAELVSVAVDNILLDEIEASATLDWLGLSELVVDERL
jgi:hypothetical protein